MKHPPSSKKFSTSTAGSRESPTLKFGSKLSGKNNNLLVVKKTRKETLTEEDKGLEVEVVPARNMKSVIQEEPEHGIGSTLILI